MIAQDEVFTVKYRAIDKLRRDLGADIEAALADPKTVEIMLNADGKLWQERLGEGMRCMGVMPAHRAEAVIKTVAGFHGKEITRYKPLLGCFHVVGGFESLASAPVIVIAEGYATAATLKEALDMPTVSAFDAGNLKAVAQELKSKFPRKPIVIAADDDKDLEITQSINPGKEMAMEACSKVNGFIVVPVFAPGEQDLIPKRFSDFNDLARNSVLGMDGVKRQVKPVVDKLVHRYSRVQQQNSRELQL